MAVEPSRSGHTQHVIRWPRSDSGGSFVWFVLGCGGSGQPFELDCPRCTEPLASYSIVPTYTSVD